MSFLSSFTPVHILGHLVKHLEHLKSIGALFKLRNGLLACSPRFILRCSPLRLTISLQGRRYEGGDNDTVQAIFLATTIYL